MQSDGRRDKQDEVEEEEEEQLGSRHEDRSLWRRRGSEWSQKCFNATETGSDRDKKLVWTQQTNFFCFFTFSLNKCCDLNSVYRKNKYATVNAASTPETVSKSSWHDIL